MSRSLEGKVVLVTGGAGNIGRVVTRTLLDEGARVAVPFYKHDPGDLADELRSEFGGRVLVFALDLTTERGAAEAVQEVLEWADRLDAVVHMVGGYAGGMKVDATPVEVWDRMMELNARSAFLVGRAAAREMLGRGGGALLFVSAREAVRRPASRAAYAASKTALLALADAMAEEYRDQGIRVNLLLPGTVDTEANRQAMPGADPSDWTAPETFAARVRDLLAGDATGERVEV